MQYAAYVTRRGLISNTFGNMVIRVEDENFDGGVLYTKCRGISLEECTGDNIVITSIHSNSLLCGTAPPSTGHQMSREIMVHRKDVNAIVHTHANEICAYFSSRKKCDIEYVGNDTALVLGSPPKVLPAHINLELEADAVKDYVMNSSCFVMPNHGMVTVGRSLSEAYHRHIAFLNEIKRLLLTKSIYPNDDSCYLKDAEVKALYAAGDRVIYGIES